MLHSLLRQRRALLLLLVLSCCGVILTVSAAGNVETATARSLLSTDMLRVSKAAGAQAQVAASIPQVQAMAVPQQQQQQPYNAVAGMLGQQSTHAAGGVQFTPPTRRVSSVSTWQQARAAAAAQAQAQAAAQAAAHTQAQAAAAQEAATAKARAQAFAQAQAQKTQASLQYTQPVYDAQVAVYMQQQYQQPVPSSTVSLMSVQPAAAEPAVFRKTASGTKAPFQGINQTPQVLTAPGANTNAAPRGNLKEQFEKYKLSLPPNLLSPAQRAQLPAAPAAAGQPKPFHHSSSSNQFGIGMGGQSGSFPSLSPGGLKAGAMPSFGSMPSFGGMGSLPGLGGGSSLPGFGQGAMPSLGGGMGGFGGGLGGLGAGMGGGLGALGGGGTVGGFGGSFAGGGLPDVNSIASSGSLPGVGSGGLPGLGSKPRAGGGVGGGVGGIGGSSEIDPKSASWPEEPGVMIQTEPSGEGLEAHTHLSFRMGMARLYDPFACMGAMAGLTPLRRHVTGVVAALLQRRGVEHKVTSGVLDCTAETFQNTTIIIVLDVAYHPKDEEVMQKIVQYMTVDYGMEFCDFYGARCNRQLVETCRVKAVHQIPKDVKMSWVEHKVPIPPKGYAGAVHVQSSPDTASSLSSNSPAANSPAASVAAAATAKPAAMSFANFGL